MAEVGKRGHNFICGVCLHTHVHTHLECAYVCTRAHTLLYECCAHSDTCIHTYSRDGSCLLFTVCSPTLKFMLTNRDKAVPTILPRQGHPAQWHLSPQPLPRRACSEPPSGSVAAPSGPLYTGGSRGVVIWDSQSSHPHVRCGLRSSGTSEVSEEGFPHSMQIQNVSDKGKL